MKAKPRGERGWWFEPSRMDPGRMLLCCHDTYSWRPLNWYLVALCRLCRLQARELARLREDRLWLAREAAYGRNEAAMEWGTPKRVDAEDMIREAEEARRG